MQPEQEVDDGLKAEIYRLAKVVAAISDLLEQLGRNRRGGAKPGLARLRVQRRELGTATEALGSRVSDVKADGNDEWKQFADFLYDLRDRAWDLASVIDDGLRQRGDEGKRSAWLYALGACSNIVRLCRYIEGWLPGGGPTDLDAVAFLAHPYGVQFVDVADEGYRAMVTDSRAVAGGAKGPGGEPDPAVAVDVYSSSDDDDKVQRIIAAAHGLAELLGYEGAVDERIHRGSVWRRARALLRSGIDSRELRDRLIKAERALELKHVELRQAEVDSKQAEAVSRLIDSMTDVPEVCVRVGSILVVKFLQGDKPVVFGRSLSQREIRVLERFPEIMIHPRNVVTSLGWMVERAEQDGASERGEATTLE